MKSFLVFTISAILLLQGCGLVNSQPGGTNSHGGGGHGGGGGGGGGEGDDADETKPGGNNGGADGNKPAGNNGGEAGGNAHEGVGAEDVGNEDDIPFENDIPFGEENDNWNDNGIEQPIPNHEHNEGEHEDLGFLFGNDLGGFNGGDEQNLGDDQNDEPNLDNEPNLNNQPVLDNQPVFDNQEIPHNEEVVEEVVEEVNEEVPNNGANQNGENQPKGIEGQNLVGGSNENQIEIVEEVVEEVVEEGSDQVFGQDNKKVEPILIEDPIPTEGGNNKVEPPKVTVYEKQNEIDLKINLLNIKKGGLSDNGKNQLAVLLNAKKEEGHELTDKESAALKRVGTIKTPSNEEQKGKVKTVEPQQNVELNKAIQKLYLPKKKKLETTAPVDQKGNGNVNVQPQKPEGSIEKPQVVKKPAYDAGIWTNNPNWNGTNKTVKKKSSPKKGKDTNTVKKKTEGNNTTKKQQKKK